MRPEEAAAAALSLILSAAALPADHQLREFFRAHPALGKRDRAQVADWVFDALRNLRLYRELVQRQRENAAPDAENAQDPIVERALDLIRIARGGAQSLPALLPVLLPAIPPAVRFSLPDWLWERLHACHGARAEAVAQVLLQPSPIDLRVNLLRGKADVLRRHLAERGIEAAPIEGIPTALRVAGRPNLERLDLFERGWFEIQDAGSQRIADLCEARRGQLVVDFCAGAGGKSLALAARMRNTGQVLAFDTGEERLSRLLPRARRANVDIVRTMRIAGSQDPRLERYRRRADVVLVDAPCSGTGTLRRNPELKWRLTPARLADHAREQQEILTAAAALVKPGGRLVYATCSLLQEENRDQADRFTAAESGFEPTHVENWLPDGGRSSGFFVAKWIFRALQTPPPGTIQ